MKRRLTQLILFVVSLELLLRIAGINRTQAEQQLGTYQYFFKNEQQTWFYAWPTNQTISLGNHEFEYSYITNENGHREKPFSQFSQDSSSLKFVCLGASFTEGDGAPYDSSWVRFFEKGLSLELDTAVNCYNAGVCGSDALYNGVMLREKLIQAKPHAVLECLNNGELTNIYYRGGFDRFSPDGTINSPNYKWWEPIYKYSYFARAAITIFGDYDKNLCLKKNMQSEEYKGMEIIATQIIESYELCKKNEVKYYLIIHPDVHDTQFYNMHYFQDLVGFLPDEIPVINLYPSLLSFYQVNDISLYSWQENGHYNSKGYQLMSEHILQAYLKLSHDAD